MCLINGSEKLESVLFKCRKRKNKIQNLFLRKKRLTILSSKVRGTVHKLCDLYKKILPKESQIKHLQRISSEIRIFEFFSISHLLSRHFSFHHVLTKIPIDIFSWITRSSTSLKLKLR
jgi:hypothetical protein